MKAGIPNTRTIASQASRETIRRMRLSVTLRALVKRQDLPSR